MGEEISTSHLRWLLTRASRMSVPELVFRIREFFVKNRLSRSPFGPFITFRIPTITWSTVKSQAEQLSNKDYNDLLLDFRVYGVSWPRGEGGLILWNCFLDGSDTSEIPTFDISYRRKELLNQDIRFSWELNRLTWLLKIAVFGKLSDREQAARWFRDFLHHDRVGFGLRWNSMNELALQAISIQLLISLLDGMLVNEDIELSNQALTHRYFWIRKLPSKYSSANNHRLTELVALISISELSGDSRSSERWQRKLTKELLRQTLPDGFHAELSADYHLFVLDLLITLNVLCPNLRYSKQINYYKNQMALATYELRILNQIWPAFGDSDEATILATLVPRPNRAKFLENLSGCMVGSRDESNFGKLRTFKDRGCTVFYDNSRDSRISLLVDHGPIGFGKTAAHGHADTLGVWLVFNEFPVLIEAGTFSYHSSEETRDLLRSGWMHNTVTVDGESLSKPSGPFLWIPRRSARGKLLSFDVHEENVHISVEADFPRSSQHKKGTVKRNVMFDGHEVRILDSTSVGETLESHFILSPLLKISRGGSSHQVLFTSVCGIRVTFKTKQPNYLNVEQVEISPTYGSLTRAYRLSVMGYRSNEVSIHLDRLT